VPLSGMSGTESASRGQQIARPLAAMNEKLIQVTSLGQKTVTPLESIDAKMTKLLDALKGGVGAGGATPGGGGGGGTGPAGGGTPGGGGGKTPDGAAAKYVPKGPPGMLYGPQLPNPGGSGAGTAYDLIKAAGGTDEEARMMAAIAQQESSGNPKAHNTRGPDDSYGLWQINMKGALAAKRLKQYGLKSKEDLYDPATNARIALAMKRKAGGYRDWGAYNSGAYKKYLGNRTSIKGGVQVASGDPNEPVKPGTPVVPGSPITPGGYRLPLTEGAAGRGYETSIGKMQPEFRARLEAMMKAAPAGASVFSGYRSEADQERIRHSSRAGYAARGNHHTMGDAADLRGDLDWFHKHAADYGLQFPMWPAGKKSITEAWHVQADPSAKVPIPGISPASGVANGAGFQSALHDLRKPIKITLDTSEAHAAIDKLHHKIKNPPKCKVSHHHEGHSHRVQESMDRRLSSSNVPGMA
jgi:hypothetical protein